MVLPINREVAMHGTRGLAISQTDNVSLNNSFLFACKATRRGRDAYVVVCSII